MNNQWTPTRLAQAAALLLSGVWAFAAQAETPISLTFSETLSYDSNVLRNNNNKYRDFYSATGANVSFNKDYGRQNYSASGQVVAYRYKNTDLYNNDGFNLSLGFSTTISTDWLLSLKHSRTRQLQPAGEQGTTRYKEIVSQQSSKAYLQYGLHGKWSVNGEVSQAKLGYDTFDAGDKDTTRARVGLRFSPTDLLYFDGGVSKTMSDSPNEALRQAETSDKVDRTDADMNVQWIVTGYSSLNGRLAWTREAHPHDTLRNFHGLTGGMSWNYSPAGKVTYNVGLERDTNNSGGQSLLFGLAQQTRNQVMTGVSTTATWAATSKISATAGLSIKQYKEKQDRSGLFVDNTSESRSGLYRSLSMGVSYSPTRYSTLSCDIETYKRNSSLFSVAFDGQSLSCSAAIKIDP
jgi:hypothetical protein